MIRIVLQEHVTKYYSPERLLTHQLIKVGNYLIEQS